MPRFMGFVRMEEGVGTPPQALFDAMDEYISERAAKGVFLDGGGLYGTEDAVNYVVRHGEVTRVDGPYAEAKRPWPARLRAVLVRREAERLLAEPPEPIPLPHDVRESSADPGRTAGPAVWAGFCVSSRGL